VESFAGLVVERGTGVAAARPRPDGSSPSAELEQPRDRRYVDVEATCDLASRSFAAVDGGNNPLSKIIR
jgi:hypothetical protein